MPGRSFDFHLPTKIVFGTGRVAELESHLPSGIDKIFIVTDGTIAKKTPILERVVKALPGKDIKAFDRIEENPSIETVEEAGREARAFGAHLILGLGGGSPMDAAKGVAVLAANPEPLSAYLAGKPLEHDPVPVVALPTTSGTGSEVTPFAVFTDRTAKQKMGFSHPGIFPLLALVDPELTYSMPVSVVLDTGLDVLAHAVEAYLSTLSFPLNDAFALHAIDIVLTELPRAARKDPEAMNRMAAAATVAGAAIAQASTILPHIMGYPLTVYHGVPHGRASVVMLVHVMTALRTNSTTPGKVRSIETLFAPYRGLDGFLRGLGVSTKLSEYGVWESEIQLYAEKTIVKGDVKITPTEVTVESLMKIYRQGL